MFVGVTLADAVDRYRREAEPVSSDYEWYRKQAQRDGKVPLGGSTVTAVKVGRRWMVDVAEVERAIEVHRERVADRRRATEDYKTHVLRGSDGSTIETDWGGYQISGDFHFTWSSYENGTRKSDGAWYCNSCFKPGSEEHEREECHTCRDRGSCGRGCTLSRIFCTYCWSSRPL